jgi:hypothetical protein
MFGDVGVGGLHESNPSGSPCTRFGVVHACAAGTSEALNGVAALGLTYRT